MSSIVQTRSLPGALLEVFPLCLGGNVFGWSASEDQSFEILDLYVAAGGNFIDTADTYTERVPGNRGGESERIIGRWLESRGGRPDLLLATKVGKYTRRPGLSAQNIREALADSLERLQTSYVDVYYAHQDDSQTPIAETLEAFTELIEAGLVRNIAASNFSPERLRESVICAERLGLRKYVAVQPEYNLLERSYESELRAVCEAHGIACLPYYSLAKGFLTGKYRPGVLVDSVRSDAARAYLGERGLAVLDALDTVAAARSEPIAAIALAWLVQQPTVLSAIASARSPDQLHSLLRMKDIELTSQELELLDTASGLRRT